MANLKNITDLPVAESVEGLKLIVNDNGSAKQIPARAIGAQANQSQVDFSQNDETAIDYIKNRTHYTEEKKFFKNIQTDSMTIAGYNYIAADLGLLSEIIGNDSTEFDFLRVIYDGEEYYNLGRDYEKKIFYKWTFYNDEAAPFLMTEMDSDNKNVYLVTPDAGGTHSIKIIFEEIVHKLDTKYIGSDMVINYDGSSATIESGSYKTIRDKLDNGEDIKITLISIISATGTPHYVQHSVSINGSEDFSSITAIFIDVPYSNTLQIREASISNSGVAITLNEISLG